MFWGIRDNSDLISMVSFTFTIRRHLIRLASGLFTSSRLVGFCLPCATPGNGAERIIYRGWVKTPVLFFLFVNQRSRNFGQCRGPLVLSNVLAWLSMSRFVQKIFAIKSRSRRKTEQRFLAVISQERLKIEVKLLLSANRKPYMPRRLAQQRMILSDREWPFHASRAISA